MKKIETKSDLFNAINMSMEKLTPVDTKKEILTDYKQRFEDLLTPISDDMAFDETVKDALTFSSNQRSYSDKGLVEYATDYYVSYGELESKLVAIIAVMKAWVKRMANPNNGYELANPQEEKARQDAKKMKVKFDKHSKCIRNVRNWALGITLTLLGVGLISLFVMYFGFGYQKAAEYMGIFDAGVGFLGFMIERILDAREKSIQDATCVITENPNLAKAIKDEVYEIGDNSSFNNSFINLCNTNISDGGETSKDEKPLSARECQSIYNMVKEDDITRSDAYRAAKVIVNKIGNNSSFNNVKLNLFNRNNTRKK